MERERFIAGVRQALGRGKGAIAPDYGPLQESPRMIEERAAQVWEKLQLKGGRLAQKLAEVAEARGWRVFRAPGARGALDYVCDLAQATGCLQVVRSGQEVFQAVPVDGPLSGLGVRVTVMSRDSGLSEAELRVAAAEARMGITGADYAIAETGSVVLLGQRGTSRLVSLLPPIHVALVLPRQILDNLEDLFVLRRAAYHGGGHDMGSYLNFITGPSRTADIEQRLIVGVHGPREAHLVLIE
jgi:L-lactate dehydrogenase complex protein LldG